MILAVEEVVDLVLIEEVIMGIEAILTEIEIGTIMAREETNKNLLLLFQLLSVVLS